MSKFSVMVEWHFVNPSLTSILLLFFLFHPLTTGILQHGWCAIYRSTSFYPSSRIYFRNGQLPRPPPLRFPVANFHPWIPSDGENVSLRRISGQKIRFARHYCCDMVVTSETFESLGGYFHNSVIRDFLACLTTSTKLTKREKQPGLSNYGKRTNISAQ